MARALRIEYKGAFYHITSRGNEKRTIFFSKSDHYKFESYLEEAKNKYGYRLHSFVLMPNHYHLLIETPEGNLSKLMHYINSSYTNYINRSKERSGHLFQGRYKAILVDRDNYLLELSRYIHINPVKAGIVEAPQDYPYSSYRFFINKKEEGIVSRDLIWDMISKQRTQAPARYRSFVERGITGELENPLKDIYGGAILGSNIFVKEALRKVKESILGREEISYRRELRSRIEAGDVLNMVADYFGLSLDSLLQRKGQMRSVTVFLMKFFTGMTNKEIGEYFGGLNYSAVAKIKKRFSDNLMEDRALKKRMEELVKQMSNVKG
jgi:putative transposase